MRTVIKKTFLYIAVAFTSILLFVLLAYGINHIGTADRNKISRNDDLFLIFHQVSSTDFLSDHLACHNNFEKMAFHQLMRPITVKLPILDDISLPKGHTSTNIMYEIPSSSIDKKSMRSLKNLLKIPKHDNPALLSIKAELIDSGIKHFQLQLLTEYGLKYTITSGQPINSELETSQKTSKLQLTTFMVPRTQNKNVTEKDESCKVIIGYHGNIRIVHF